MYLLYRLWPMLANQINYEKSITLHEPHLHNGYTEVILKVSHLHSCNK